MLQNEKRERRERKWFYIYSYNLMRAAERRKERKEKKEEKREKKEEKTNSWAELMLGRLGFRPSWYYVWAELVQNVGRVGFDKVDIRPTWFWAELT